LVTYELQRLPTFSSVSVWQASCLEDEKAFKRKGTHCQDSMQCLRLDCWSCRPSPLDSMLRMAVDTRPRLENMYWLVAPIRPGSPAVCRWDAIQGGPRALSGS
jgi:hypothetical protein